MLPIGNTRHFSLLQVVHQILNSTHLDPPLLTKPQTPIPPHHAIIPRNLRNSLNNLPILNQLRNHTSRRLPSQLAEVHRSLGVSRPLEYTTRTRLQRDDMARPAER